MAKPKAIEQTEEVKPTSTVVHIDSAVLHSPIMVPSLPAEVNLNRTKIPTIEMSIAPYGLLCSAKEKKFIVPYANIKCMVIK